MSANFAALAQAIRERIQADTELLDYVLKMWAESESTPSANSLNDLVSIADIAKATAGKVTTNQARWLARNRESNGLSDAFTKIGKTLYIDLPKLKALIAGKGGDS
jgi:hypothetical protein